MTYGWTRIEYVPSAVIYINAVLAINQTDDIFQSRFVYVSKTVIGIFLQNINGTLQNFWLQEIHFLIFQNFQVAGGEVIPP
jgi:hypothetical protein